MKAILRNLRISPKKVNLIAALVRGKKAVDAIDILKFTPKKSARPMMKLIESAVANAVNNFKQDKEDLIIKEIIVNEATTYKRSVPVSRGRSNPIMKRNAHITIKLAVLDGAKKKESTKKEKEVEVKEENVEVKEVAKKTTKKIVKKSK